jgi:hypothetical protein
LSPDCGGAIISQRHKRSRVVTWLRDASARRSTPAASDTLGIDPPLVRPDGRRPAMGMPHVGRFFSGSPLIENRAGSWVRVRRSETNSARPRTDGDHDGLVVMRRSARLSLVQARRVPRCTVIRNRRPAAPSSRCRNVEFRHGEATRTGNALLLRNWRRTGGWRRGWKSQQAWQLYAQARRRPRGARGIYPGWSASTAPSGGQVSPDRVRATVTQSLGPAATLVHERRNTWNFRHRVATRTANAVLLNEAGPKRPGGLATALEVRQRRGSSSAQLGQRLPWWRWNNPGWSVFVSAFGRPGKTGRVHALHLHGNRKAARHSRQRAPNGGISAAASNVYGNARPAERSAEPAVWATLQVFANGGRALRAGRLTARGGGVN